VASRESPVAKGQSPVASCQSQSNAADVLVIGGGPAGSASARLLASWGHRVRLVTKAADRRRGLAESLPPSTHKLLAEIGVLDDIVRAGFYRSTGNTVYWAAREPRIESFDGLGFQVFRPELDLVMLESAARTGVSIETSDFRLQTSDFPIVLDCSGRAGVIGRQHRVFQPEHRTAALVGVWRRDGAWPTADESHTLVETFDEGWAWSVPTSRDVRHVGIMVERGAAYDEVVARTHAMRALVDGAELQHTFACDASLYHADRYAAPGVFLVGDAGSFIDPLSSFGVKKALASAWMAAVAAHTCLIDSARVDAAVAFFDTWEQRVYDDHLRRSRDFARAAVDAHPGQFWASRAAVEVADRDGADDREVRAAFEQIRDAAEIEFVFAEDVRVEPQPVIRGHEIVLEPAFVGPVLQSAAGPRGPALRFAGEVDLVALAHVACGRRRVPDMYDAYCRMSVPAPLPSVLAGLSLLVARGILRANTPAALDRTFRGA
jgi:flavin-dependent dehydrogenase